MMKCLRFKRPLSVKGEEDNEERKKKEYKVKTLLVFEL